MFNLVLTSKKVLYKATGNHFHYNTYIISDGMRRFHHSYSQLSHSRLCILKALNNFALKYPGISVSFSVDIEKIPFFVDLDKPCTVYHYELFKTTEV